MFKLALIPFIILLVIIICLMPFAYIWALNTLFPSLNIPSNFTTWCAMVVAHGFFHLTVSRK